MKANTNTDTSTTSYTQTAIPNIQDGWRCPRCGRINAPWVRQCDCSPSICDWDKITINPCNKDWWKTQITCDENMFKVHPDSITYCTDVAGGSDYTYVNIHGTQSNKVGPDVTAQNYTNPDNCHTPHYTTETVVSDNLEPLTRHFKD